MCTNTLAGGESLVCAQALLGSRCKYAYIEPSLSIMMNEEQGRMSKRETHDDSLPLDALSQYIRQVRWTPDLIEAEEAHLIQCVQRGRVEQSQPRSDQRILDEAQRARDRLVEGYQPFVVFLAKRHQFKSRSMQLLDLVQEGNFGLLKAIETYAVGSTHPLRALAGKCIEGAIEHALRDRDGMVRLPRRVYESVQKWRCVRNGLFSALDREPTLLELAEQMGVELEEMYALAEYERQRGVESIEGLLEDSELGDEKHEFVSLFQASRADEDARQEQVAAMVQEALETVLTTRQRQIVTLRYGLTEEHGPRLQKEVAKDLGVTKSSVLTTEQLARDRLREVLAPLYSMAQDEEVA